MGCGRDEFEALKTAAFAWTELFTDVVPSVKDAVAKYYLYSLQAHSSTVNWVDKFFGEFRLQVVGRLYTQHNDLRAPLPLHLNF